MTGKHPRLYGRVKRRKSGRVVVYYAYDMRPEGRPDVQLGTDYDEALRQWDELHHGRARRAGTVEEAMRRWEEEKLPGYSGETLKGYTKHLRTIRPVFGPATWDGITLPVLVEYLARRSAKTQANREMSLLALIWKHARLWGLTDQPWPAAGMERSGWKNRERAREVTVSDAAFAAVYAQADQVLKDCMDLATATGMRLSDCRSVQMPRGDVLHVRASKTGKRAQFDISLSAVLPQLIERRRASGALHTLLLSTERGRPVTEAMLRGRWDAARAAAAAQAEADGDEALAEEVRGLYLRDMRKRAANLAPSADAASELLQHSSRTLTMKHYRTVGDKLKPTR